MNVAPLLRYSFILCLVFSTALPNAPVSLPASAQAIDRKAEADQFQEQANQLYQRGQLSEALRAYQQVLSIRQTIGDRDGEGAALYNLGRTYYGLSQFTEALQAYQSALEIRQALNDMAGSGVILNGIGRIYYKLAQYRQALDAFQRSLELRQQSQDKAGEAITLDDLGNLYRSLGNYTKALELHQRALTIVQALNDQTGEGNILNHIGLAYEELSQYQQALAAYQQALAIFRATNNASTVSRILTNIGSVYIHLGQLQAAEQAFQEALTLAGNQNNSTLEGVILNNIGIVYERSGRYPKALDLYQRALTIFQTRQDLSGQADTLNNIGVVYERLGEYGKALSFYQQVYSIRQTLNDRVGAATALNNVGTLYRLNQQYAKALEIHQQALESAKASADSANVGVALNSLGATYSAQGNYRKALEFYQQALDIRTQLGDRPGEGVTLSNLGNTYQNLREFPQAFSFYEQALGILQATGDRAAERVTLSNMADLYQSQNQPDLAIALYKQSVNISETIRQDLRALSREQQETYTRTVADTYRALAGLLLSQSRVLEAQQVLELLKAEEVREFTRGAKSAEQAGVTINPAEAKILKEYGSLIAFGQKVYDCKQTPQCPKLSQLNDQLQVLTQQYNQNVASFRDAIRNRPAIDPNSLDPTKLINLKRIVEAQPGTVLIYPLVLEDKIWLLWAAKGGIVKSVELPVTQKQLGTTVLKFRQGVQDTRLSLTATQTAGKQLYDWLIKPLESELKANQIHNLVFALDRVTRYIPVSALFDGEKYLVENYAVSTVLSADLTDLSDRLPPGTQSTSVLAVGASEFPNLNALPNVPAELDAIVRKQATDASGIYPGLEFLNRNFDFRSLRDNLPGHKILHIATHASFVVGSPEESYLVLGTGDKLTIPTIQTLQDLSDVHLVVLSACETALGGPDQDGVEISGLSSYFLSSGAKAVVASLWSVDDASTSLLMQAFYSSLANGTVQKPITKAEALRQAQLILLTGKATTTGSDSRGINVVANGGTRSTPATATPFSHPFYWAPFVLIGNGL